MKPFKTLLLLLLATYCLTACAQKPSKKEKINLMNTETITLGSGCFWCTEAIYQRLEGVLSVTSGYSGGHIVNPTYEQVCDKTTGHAEVCQIVFDTTKISLDDILAVYWKTHDPTTLDQQGNDIGPQYKSAIYYHNAEQKITAEKYKTELDKSGKLEFVFEDYDVEEDMKRMQLYALQIQLHFTPHKPFCIITK
jgi:peptide-methionine (S)-S-oxide reductase